MKKKPSMLRRFAAYFAPHKGLFIADNAAGVLLAACDLFYPNITRTILNTHIPAGDFKMIGSLAAVLLVI